MKFRNVHIALPRVENGEMRLDIPDDYDEEEDEHANVRYVQDGDKIKVQRVPSK